MSRSNFQVFRTADGKWYAWHKIEKKCLFPNLTLKHDDNFAGYFHTRKSARKAVESYQNIQIRLNKKPVKAIVTPMVNPDGSGCVRFEIIDSPFGKGSEPICNRTYEETLVRIGMVLQMYGVTEFEMRNQ